MSNKKTFKKLYSKKINKNCNYETIIDYIERNNMKRKNNLSILTLVPTCLIAIVCAFLVFDKNDNNITLKPNNSMTNGGKNHQFSINNIETSKNGVTKFDADIKIANYYMIPYFDFLSNLNIPNDFDNKEDFRAIYVKSNKYSDNYDVLNNYELWLRNTTNNRKIIIAFSNEHEPLRDYFFNDKGGKISKINDFELKIYKYENSYMTTFTYNNINFDIETNDISEQEFIDLLISIIK